MAEASVDRNSAASLFAEQAQGLREIVRGPVILPDHPDYDTVRSVWNAAIDRRPAVIVRCTGTADVVASVGFAREHGMPVAVRGGGHNVAGSAVCDGGLVIDLSLMKGVHVDAERATARAQGGVTWGEFDHETQVLGLATTGGFCSETGIAGVTLGAGFGWLMRKYGTALDNLVSFDIVTPDGQLRTASAEENSDLFFAVRGSHSNFGVVTSLEYRLHPVGPTVLGGMVLHPLGAAPDVLRFYRDYSRDAPEELGSAAALLTAPDGNKMIAVIICYHGDAEAGEKVIEPLRRLGPPAADLVQPMPYVRMQSLFDEAFPPGRHAYWRSNFLDELSDGVIDALVDGYGNAASPYSSILIEHLGGAVARVGHEDSAFSHRDSPYNCVIMPAWTDAAESEAHKAWADSLWKSLQDSTSGGVYVNYLGEEGEERVRAAYGRSYERLRALKQAYDPDNLFRFNQNIA